MTLEEAIKHARDVAENNSGTCEECIQEHKQLAEWLEELKHLREQAERFQWVPVSERTPDDYGAVLLQYKNRRWLETEKRETLDIGYFDAFGNEELREGCENFRGEVIAWMPLPEPYKEQRNDIRTEEKIRK